MLTFDNYLYLSAQTFGSAIFLTLLEYNKTSHAVTEKYAER